MTNRNQIATKLDQLEQDIKSLEIAYEQYFMGIEKREPQRERQRISLQLRRLVTHYIPQVDLRFRLQSISSRFHSYAGHWDRILRLIDEGRYERHTSRIERTRGASASPQAKPAQDPIEDLYEKLADAHRTCGLKVPLKEQVAKLLALQKEVIREKFGGRAVDFHVVTENGKPKIKVRAKS